MMHRRPISFSQPLFVRRFGVIIRSRPQPVLHRRLSPLQPSLQPHAWLYELRRGVRTPLRVKRGILVASKAIVKDAELPLPVKPQWREAEPEPSVILIRRDLDPSLPPEIYGSVEFEVEVSQGTSHRYRELQASNSKQDFNSPPYAEGTPSAV